MSEATHDHHGPSYIQVYTWLIILLIISITGPMLEIQVITLITAFGIACVKAYLVAAHFMHLKVEPRAASIVIIGSLAMMAIFYFGVAPDVMKHEGQNWKNVAAEAEVERALQAVASGSGHGGDAHADNSHAVPEAEH